MDKIVNEADRLDAAEIIGRAKTLLPALRDRAADCEAQGRLPDRTIEDLHNAGLFDLIRPKRYGGHEAGWDLFNEVAMEISSACGSTGWVFSVLGQHPLMMNRFGIDLMDEIWGDNERALVASSKQIKGTLERVPGGFRGSLEATFSSGCLHADWVLIGGTPVKDEQTMVGVVVPIGDVEILDTWDVVGLKGTGSHDIRVTDVFVPDHRARVPGKPPSGGVVDAPTYRTTGIGAPLSLASVVLGTASGALDLFVHMMRSRVSRAGLKLGDQQTIQLRIGEAAAEIDAAKALLRTHLKSVMQLLQDAPPPNSGGGYQRQPGPPGLVPGPPSVATIHADLADAYIAQLALNAVDRLFYAAGATELKLSSDLQRCYRDVLAGSRQFGLNWDSARVTAATRLMTLEDSDRP